MSLERTRYPGVYRRGTRFVVVYRSAGRQRKESAASLAEARALKPRRDTEAREQRRGPLRHPYALAWLDRYAGSGHDAVRENTRREYRRLLETFALRYFDRNVYVADLDVARVQGLVDRLTSQPGRAGHLSDRSIANVLHAVARRALRATAEGWLDKNPAAALSYPDDVGGRSRSAKEARYLPRAELARLVEEIPEKWKPLFDLLAVTGLRISRPIALRWSDLDSIPDRLARE